LYFIVVKFETKPEFTESWLDLTREFTEATREEPGNLWFEWSISAEEPHTFVLVEGFADDGAGPHVGSAHFKKAVAELPQYLAHTPRIVSRQVDGDAWDAMGEMQVD
jgi:quinol monooxygenase YgiN